MSPGFTVEPRDGYLHMQLAPGFELTPESVMRFWGALSDACSEQGQQKVLVEGDAVQRKLTTMDSFDSAALAGRLLPGLSVALCFRGYAVDEQTQFFLVAAMNRGVRAEFFEDRDAALRWLAAAG
jgi:hypothetical protein